eukprot:4749936-Pyramimonas_sp.AAC.1
MGPLSQPVGRPRLSTQTATTRQTAAMPTVASGSKTSASTHATATYLSGHQKQHEHQTWGPI